MNTSFSEWLKSRLSDGIYFGFVAESVFGEPIAGIGLMELDWPPHPIHPGEARRGAERRGEVTSLTFMSIMNTEAEGSQAS